MQLLLWIEELQHEVDIRQYDMPQATLKEHGGQVELHVSRGLHVCVCTIACLLVCVFVCICVYVCVCMCVLVYLCLIALHTLFTHRRCLVWLRIVHQS